MTAIYVDPQLTDDQRRSALYNGALVVLSPSRASLALCELARQQIAGAFPDLDPETAQQQLPVEEYAARLAVLKPKFIHHPDCKRIIQELLGSAGCDPDQTFFDVPRLRTSTSDGYLTTGIAYAFHAHRDTWYSAPMCQINWWMPIYPITVDNGMAFHPHHWENPLPNSSHTYNYQNWNATNRFNAATHIGKDTRVQPKATAPVVADPDIRLVTPPGGVQIFSAAHLHSSIENLSGRTRFSIDFRTVHLGDATALRGAPNVDSNCTGTAIVDFLRVADLQRVPEAVANKYMNAHPQSPQLACTPPVEAVAQ